MSSLQENRLGRLHKQFLDAAEQYPGLHFAAVTDRSADADWPSVPDRSGNYYLGLPEPEWREILRKRPGTFFAPLSARWIRLNDQLWEGAFFNGGELWEDVKEQFAHLQKGIVEFERVARLAAGHFDVSASPHPSVDFPLGTNPADRWLEILCLMEFVEKDNREAFFVRRVPGDVFTASARAIETLADVDVATLRPKVAQSDTQGNAAQRRPTVNNRMKAELASNLEAVKGWTAQQWADSLGCGKSTVIGTETWISLSLLRQQAKAERRRDRRGTKPV